MRTAVARAAVNTTISVPEELADRLYERKGRGETYADVIERLLEDAERAEGVGTEPTDAEPPPVNEVAEEPAQAPEPEPVDEPADLETLLEDVGQSILPGSGEKLEARIEALRAVVAYLREHGTATPAHFRDDVYPDHVAGYTGGQDPATSWWKNAMYPALAELAERTDAIESADTTGKWTYRGATDE